MTDFLDSNYSVGMVVGDMEQRISTNGRTFNLVTVDTPGGRTRKAIYWGKEPLAPFSFVALRIQPRGAGFGYTIVKPNDSVKEFLRAACDYWALDDAKTIQSSDENQESE